ncbi:hypothetical protein BAUCODRAFT_439310 [Baudoinia panamericana UAMH 10762]|uniref:Uncharacterized protein n=1 Tax=Baudoinia panamericana (strain UAMH 10762) TaxID=717646 RepID=M2NDZ8_BAUPA|nr:uncharacterized protein BAUCODRAFT_439310 [Baudoinia panamericana UAMH 10762]EMC97150.1 hypothetical protein BAUCODRAFT_439310 [Baudoinia panamericana UAMH 10762]
MTGVTAKSIKHRISKIRTAGKDIGPTTSKATGPKAKSTKSKKVAGTPASDKDDVEAILTPPPSKGKGRKRRPEQDVDTDGEGEVEGLSKKVKIEVGEDIGEGLRQANPAM